MRYNKFLWITDEIMRAWRKANGISKKRMTSADEGRAHGHQLKFLEKTIRADSTDFVAPGSIGEQALCTLCRIKSEMEFREGRKRIYFVPEYSLIELLMRSTMDVRMIDLYAGLPPTFLVMFPEGWSYKGTKIQSFMFMDNSTAPDHWDAGDKWLAIGGHTIITTKGSMDKFMVGKEGFSENSQGMDDMIRLAISILCYIVAVPDGVVDGFPDEAKPLRLGKHDGKIVGINECLMTGTRNSPFAHWRRPHFRRYPLRQDGERKKGVVFVEGSVVGACDPKTIREKQQ